MLEKDKTEISRYAYGVSGKSGNQSFTSGSIINKNYNFILLFKGDNNEGDYNAIWDNLICHIYSQLNVMRCQYNLYITDYFKTNNIFLIESTIKLLFSQKWQNMFKNENFYKEYKWLRITYKDIYDTITTTLKNKFPNYFNERIEECLRNLNIY